MTRLRFLLAAITLTACILAAIYVWISLLWFATWMVIAAVAYVGQDLIGHTQRECWRAGREQVWKRRESEIG